MGNMKYKDDSMKKESLNLAHSFGSSQRARNCGSCWGMRGPKIIAALKTSWHFCFRIKE